MPAVDADGTPLNVEVEGKAGAPVLMFSNSLGTDLHMWDEQARHFAKDYRVVRYDQRGHGKSGAPAGAYSIERLGRDVLAILNALDLPSVNYCGLSMGGMTGMWLARFAPERFDKMIFANTAPKSQNPDSWNTRIGVINSKGMDAIGDGVMNIWFTKEFREKNSDTIARMRATLVANKPAGYIGCCSAIRDMDQRWAISDIALPSLIIAGRSDNATPLKDSEFMKSRIAGSELVALDAGHISNVEQKAAFNAALEQFLARN
jgi:3-oxoadipate enol-lactonase